MAFLSLKRRRLQVNLNDLLGTKKLAPLIGHQDLPVAAPLPGDLLSRGRYPGVVPGGFHLHYTAGVNLTGHGCRIGELLKLLLGEETAAREASRHFSSR
jgi:hypothetical protein